MISSLKKEFELVGVIKPFIFKFVGLALDKLRLLLDKAGFFNAVKRHMVGKQLIPANTTKKGLFDKLTRMAEENPVMFATVVSIGLTAVGETVISVFDEDERALVAQASAHLPLDYDEVVDVFEVSPSADVTTASGTSVQSIKESIRNVEEISKILGIHYSQVGRLLSLLSTTSLHDVKVYEEFNR